MPFAEEQAARAIAQPSHLIDAPLQLLVELELETVLALAVGRDETEQGPGELAVRVEAVPFALDD